MTILLHEWMKNFFCETGILWMSESLKIGIVLSFVEFDWLCSFVSVIHLAVGVVYCLVSWTVGWGCIVSTFISECDNEWNLCFLQLLSHSLMLLLHNLYLDNQFPSLYGSHWLLLLSVTCFFSSISFIIHKVLTRLCNLWSFYMWIIYAGVSMASLTELSFNWLGFISAMISNISFTYRSIYSKKAMVSYTYIYIFYHFITY